jgi:hypothetical protein
MNGINYREVSADRKDRDNMPKILLFNSKIFKALLYRSLSSNFIVRAL